MGWIILSADQGIARMAEELGLVVFSAQDFLNRYFPGHVLYAEIGGDNPYNNQRDPSLNPGAHLYVFDIIGPNGSFLSPKDRYALVDRFGLPTVTRFGRYSLNRIQHLHELLRELNEREGVVMKSTDGKRESSWKGSPCSASGSGGRTRRVLTDPTAFSKDFPTLTNLPGHCPLHVRQGKPPFQTEGIAPLQPPFCGYVPLCRL